jgi:hypothetical protein
VIYHSKVMQRILFDGTFPLKEDEVLDVLGFDAQLKIRSSLMVNDKNVCARIKTSLVA